MLMVDVKHVNQTWRSRYVWARLQGLEWLRVSTLWNDLGASLRVQTITLGFGPTTMANVFKVHHQYITTSRPFFKMAPKNCDLRCVLQPSTLRSRC